MHVTHSKIQAWNKFLFATSRNFSWDQLFSGVEMGGKGPQDSGERKSSSTDPELAEMLGANQENRFCPWKKLTAGALKYRVFCQATDCTTTRRWGKSSEWLVSREL